jgi:hypothetical protein
MIIEGVGRCSQGGRECAPNVKFGVSRLRDVFSWVESSFPCFAQCIKVRHARAEARSASSRYMFPGIHVFTAAKTWMAGTHAKTRFALLPGHDEQIQTAAPAPPVDYLTQVLSAVKAVSAAAWVG